ncbi:MAG: ATP-binding protein [Salinirussus sp.]
MRVIGRDPDQTDPEDGSERTDRSPATGRLGRYRARDGSEGGRVGLDLDRPHVAVVVGKRGAGKSYTLGVIAEALARAAGTVPVVVDPMGTFGPLARSALDVRAVPPAVRADALSPRTWCEALGLDPGGGPGSLVWRAASEAASLDGMRSAVTGATADDATRRAALNHLDLAESWGVFGTAGLPNETGAVVDLAGLDRAAMDAVCAGLAGRLYRRCLADRGVALPWLLVDEAHPFFDGIAGRSLRRLLTRGRQPGVSVVAATQRPSALPDVARSQADIVVIHRTTGRADREALAAARPSYAVESLGERMPSAPGEALILDDATETVHTVRIRERETPHGGDSPRASRRAGTSEHT